jgi:hypothetical protein
VPDPCPLDRCNDYPIPGEPHPAPIEPKPFSDCDEFLDLRPLLDRYRNITSIDGWKCRTETSERFEFDDLNEILEVINDLGDQNSMTVELLKLLDGVASAIGAIKSILKALLHTVGVEPSIIGFSLQWVTRLYQGPNGESVARNMLVVSARGRACLEVVWYFDIYCQTAWGPARTAQEEWSPER